MQTISSSVSVASVVAEVIAYWMQLFLSNDFLLFTQTGLSILPSSKIKIHTKLLI